MDLITQTDGALLIERNFLPEEDAQALFDRLIKTISWQTETYTIFGKSVIAPRLVCWMGDEGASYTYSGVTHKPVPWEQNVLALKTRIETATQTHYNSVLLNYYRDQNDSIGWHADNEKELGANPTIASLSLGDTRVFQVRHKTSNEQHEIELNSGSLVIMRGAFQHYWKHRVPKSRMPRSARINLTFRRIVEAK